MPFENVVKIELDDLPDNVSWNAGDQKVLKMHNIHWYPAKFPPFVVTTALKHAKERGKKIKRVADIFCGCGTTALESSINDMEFWGCDINPVATLIAQVKSRKYDLYKLQSLYSVIVATFHHNLITTPSVYIDHPRLNYWYTKDKIHELYRLLESIKQSTPKGKYQEFFLCAFSNILRGTSKWLTKSIKPQIDPEKKPLDVYESFDKQIKFMLKAVEESNKVLPEKSKAKITHKNYLLVNPEDVAVDLVVTSPPYVTSYEYADLHQLSSLWLGYTDDYRKLRNGSIGSTYNIEITESDVKDMNDIGVSIFNDLHEIDKRKAKSVAKYFIDMKKAVEKTYSILNEGGLATYVIGNTKYKGVEIDNTKYIGRCMQEVGFKDVMVYKRKISGKILTPFRDQRGKFSRNPNDRKVYSHEYIIVAER